jgi:hypothetical protein
MEEIKEIKERNRNVLYLKANAMSNREDGIVEGYFEEVRQVILDTLRKRFSTLPPTIYDMIQGINNYYILLRLLEMGMQEESVATFEKMP